MDNKITLSVLAQMLSDRTGSSRQECEELLRSFFRTISASLAAGEPVKVRGFGTFKISAVDARMSVDVSSGEDYEIPAHNRIVFIPAKELAVMVNAPFSMFETIELSDEVADEELMETETPAERNAAPMEDEDADAPEAPEAPEAPGSEATGSEAPGSEAPGSEAPESEVPETEAPEEFREMAEAEEAEEAAEAVEVTPSPSAPAPEKGLAAPQMPQDSEAPDSCTVVAQAQENTAIEQRRKFHHGFIWGMAAAVAVVVAGCVALYFLNDDFGAMMGRRSAPGQPPAVAAAQPAPAASGAAAADVAEAADMTLAESDVDGIVEDEVPEKDEPAVNAVPTRPSDQPVYDTVTPTSALGTLARKHYGNYHFWPYIYKENEKILGHPDRIRPGTRVVIPPLSKYGVNPNDAADLAKAKRLGAEIYARYKAKK